MYILQFEICKTFMFGYQNENYTNINFNRIKNCLKKVIIDELF